MLVDDGLSQLTTIDTIEHLGNVQDTNEFGGGIFYTPRVPLTSTNANHKRT
jgi:hypothetical protein